MHSTNPRKASIGKWPIISAVALILLLYPIFWQHIVWRSHIGLALLVLLFALVSALLLLLTLQVIRSSAFEFWRRESSIKLIFDHFRNIGLCGAIFYAADFLFTLGAFPTSILSLSPLFGAIILNIIGIVAISLQTNHFQNTIIDQGAGKINSYAVFALNFVLTTAMLQYLAFTKLAFLMKKI